MSEFPVEGGENGDMHSVMENFQKKNNLVTGRTHVSHHPQVTTTSSQVIIISDTDFFPSVFLSLTIKYLRVLPDVAARRCRDSSKDRKDTSLVFPQEAIHVLSRYVPSIYC